jgi:hypothetical protein
MLERADNCRAARPRVPLLAVGDYGVASGASQRAPVATVLSAVSILRWKSHGREMIFGLCGGCFTSLDL